MIDDTPSFGRFEGREHRLGVRVYYEDTDLTGVVYHANYLRYFERGRSEFLRCAGVDHTVLGAVGVETAFAVTQLSVKFSRPARIDDALTVVTICESLGAARFGFTQTLLRGGEKLVSAAVEICCIDLAGRPKRPPSLLLDRLKPFLTGSASSF